MSKKEQGAGNIAFMYLESWYPPQLIENGASPADVTIVPFPRYENQARVPRLAVCCF